MPIFSIASIVLVGWGALAIGGWPTWAAAPTLVLAITTGLLGFLATDRSSSRATPLVAHRAVATGFALLLAAVGVQLVPVSEPLVARVSPARLEANYERLLAVGDRRDPRAVPAEEPGAPRTLSIAPSRTWIGFGGLLAFGLLTMGAARAFSIVGVRFISRAILVLGVIVTFIEIYRIANGTISIYGLYVPMSPARESAPFINRNHQAGWLAMVLSLSLGAFAAEVARGLRGVAPRWRDRLLWFSSKEANVAALTLFGLIVVAIGILTTQSRSGATALAVTFAIVTAWGLRKQPTKARRRVLGVLFVLVLLAVVSYAGEGVAKRIATTSWDRMDGRVAIWHDAINIARTFWLTGTGFNTFGVAMLRYQTVNDSYRYIETHNDYLQFASEGGLLLGLPAIILLLAVIVTIYRRFQSGEDDTRTYWMRVGAVGAIGAIAVQSVTDFTLQMPGAAAMFALVLAIAIHHPRPRPSHREVA